MQCIVDIRWRAAVQYVERDHADLDNFDCAMRDDVQAPHM